MYRQILLCLCLATAACASTDAADDDSNDDVAESEMRVSDVKVFQIRRSQGFVPPAPAGTCYPWGSWTVDLVNRQLSGQGCVDAKPTTAERSLSGEEIGKLRKAFFEVKSGPRPEACPSDAPIMRLDVVRQTREDHYIDQRSSCAASEIPVTSESLSNLYDVVSELASEPSPE